MIRLLIDMQPLQTAASKDRGVGRYTLEVVKRLMSYSELDLILAFNASLGSISADYKYLFSEPRSKVSFMDWFPPDLENTGAEKNKRHRAISELVRELYFLSQKPDAIWCPNLQEGFREPAITSVGRLRLGDSPKWISTLHDLTPLDFPEMLLDENNEAWYFSKIGAAKASDLIITDSKHSADKISQFLGQGQEKVGVAELGVTFSDWVARGENPRSQPKNSFIYFGGVDPYKNVQILIKALAELNTLTESRFGLIFVGHGPASQKSSLVELAQALGVQEQVSIIEDSAQDVLVDLLNNSVAFVYPSLGEGFGLPALESIAAGCPVLVSNTGAIAEHGVLDESKFDPSDAAQIANRMLWVSSDLNRFRLLEKQEMYAKQLSWERCTDRIVDLIRGVCTTKCVDWGPIETEFKKNLALLSPTEVEYSAVANALLQSGLVRTGLPRIFYDVSAISVHDHRTGIHGVVKELYAALNEVVDFKIVPVWADTSTSTYRLAETHVSKDSSIGFTRNNIPAAMRKGDIYFCGDLYPGVFSEMSVTLARMTSLGILPTVYVYDIIPITNPEWFDEGLVSAFRKYIDAILEVGCTILVSSEHVKQGILAKYPLCRNRISVVGLASRRDLTRHKEQVPLSNSLTKKSKDSRIKAIMVGTIEPRKGHLDLLKIFEDPRVVEKIELTVVGAPGWKSEKIQSGLLDSAREGKVKFKGRVSDQELSIFYKESHLLIAASFDEGFGLPLVEAASYGVKVLARDIPVFREIAPQGTFFLDFSDTASSVEFLLSETFDNYIESLSASNGTEKSSTTWGTVAAQLLKEINQ